MYLILHCFTLSTNHIIPTYVERPQNWSNFYKLGTTNKALIESDHPLSTTHSLK